MPVVFVGAVGTLIIPNRRRRYGKKNCLSGIPIPKHRQGLGGMRMGKRPSASGFASPCRCFVLKIPERHWGLNRINKTHGICVLAKASTQIMWVPRHRSAVIPRQRLDRNQFGRAGLLLLPKKGGICSSCASELSGCS